MAESRWIILVRRPISIFGGPSAGTEYSLDEACPACGTGAIQIGPLKLRGFKAPKGDACMITHDGEILFSEELSAYLKGEGFKCLGPVMDSRNGLRLTVTQLVGEGTLPPFSERTSGVLREDPCAVCKRNGFFGDLDRPLRLVYDSVPGELRTQDVMATYERFGTSRLRSPMKNSVFAPSLFVVSARLVDALRRRDVRQVDFEPVEVGS